MTTEVKENLNLEVQEEERSDKVESGLHGVIGLRLGRYLGNYVEDKGLGWVFNSSTTFRVQGQPPNRQPDVAFVALERMSIPPDDDVLFAPDLAVEVISRNDSWSEIVAKANQYLHAETRLVWAIDPYSKGVFIFHKNDPNTRLLNLNDELDGEDVIPGFTLKIRELLNFGPPSILPTNQS